jgi:hypothetical protein
MTAYKYPDIKQPADPVNAHEVVLVASGDLRLSANQECWPAQEQMEAQLGAAFACLGWKVVRGHAYDPLEKHGFISSQRMGMDVFQSIPPDAPLVVAEAVWQYSHHVLAGLRDRRGPILTVGNWSGQWPGLVGLLNLNACLAKMGVEYSSLWSLDFTDDFFMNGLKEWLSTWKVTHDLGHVREVSPDLLPAPERSLGAALADELRTRKAILGIFDEGCMGMFNAIIEDDLLNPMGIYKERLSQSALVAAMRTVPDAEAGLVRQWLDRRGVTFRVGVDEAVDLTDRQILEQLKMYIAALRLADEFGCAAIGIQYQQGLKDSCPASDLAEALLNNPDRPPVYHAKTGRVLFDSLPVPHFNEVDEGAAVDMLVTNRAWTAMGLDPSTTLHDIRYGEHFTGNGLDAFVWLLQISGAAPASHFVNGYAGAVSERQPAMYFPLGGGTLKGIGRPGEIVWSRVFVMDGAVHADLGRGTVVVLPEEETERRWRMTTPQWPNVSVILHGVSRDQMMARHKANHINVAYAPDDITADKALAVKAAMLSQMGVHVHLCGEVNLP